MIALLISCLIVGLFGFVVIGSRGYSSLDNHSGFNTNQEIC